MRLEDKKHKELNGVGRSADVISVDVMDQGLQSGALPQVPLVADKFRVEVERLVFPRCLPLCDRKAVP